MMRAAAVLFLFAYTNAEYGPVHVCEDGDRYIADVEDLCRYHVCFQPNQGSVAMRCPWGTHVPLNFIDSHVNDTNAITPCSEFHYAKSCLRCEFEAADSCFNVNCGPDCTCLDLGSEHRCICEESSEVCESNPCMNGGTCTPDDVNYHCHCHEGYVGPCCSEDVITGILEQTQPTNNQIAMFSEEACINYADMKDNYQGQLIFICGGEETGLCMPLHRLCNGYYSCPDKINDHSDEEDCEEFCAAAIASGIRFTCPSSNYNPALELELGYPGGPDEPGCFSSNHLCNGFIDCANDDGFDEKAPYCSPFDRVVERSDGTRGNCKSPNTFQCFDKAFCINNECDGFADCLDSTDELDC